MGPGEEEVLGSHGHLSFMFLIVTICKLNP